MFLKVNGYGKTTDRGTSDDITNMEHPPSLRHPRMSSLDRAAQFSAFAALTGYEEIIEQTGRDYYREDQVIDEM